MIFSTLCHFVGYMFKSVVLYLFFDRQHYGPKCKSHGPQALIYILITNTNQPDFLYYLLAKYYDI